MTKLRWAAVALIAAGSISAAKAGEMVAYEGGVLNPSEYTLEKLLLKVERNELSKIECIYGYETAKHGMHDPARIIVQHCAEVLRLPPSMTFMAWMDENGYGLEGGPDLASAAEWDRRAAESGDSLAQYNYGLKLLRGRGVERDLAKGRHFIDLAAANGDRSAKELAADNYDLANVVGTGLDRLHKGKPASASVKTN